MHHLRLVVRLLSGSVVALLLCAAAESGEASRLITSGHTHLRSLQWKEASTQFERAVKMAPENPAAHLGLSLARRGAGDTEGAIKEARTALRLRPDYPEARIALGLLLQQKGDVDGAIAQYQLLLRKEPRSAEAHNWLGVAYMQKNRLAEAATELRTTLRLDPKYIRAYNNLGSTLAQAGEITDAIAVFREGLKRAPEDQPLRLNFATALRTAGNSDEAATELRKLLERDAANPELHHQLALTLREKGDLEAAVGEWETALTLNPEYRDAYYAFGQTLRRLVADLKRKRGPNAREKTAAEALGRGQALAREHDLKGAVEQIGKAVELNPASPEAQYNLGAALWYSGEEAKAMEALDAAIRLDPAAGPAYSLRGLAAREAGDLATAQRMFQRAVAVSPGVALGYFDLGVVFLRRNQLGNALGQFEAGLNLPAESGGPTTEVTAAVAELRRAISGQQNAEAYNVLGRMLGLSGASAQDIIASFQSAIKMKPDFAEAHNNLGLVYTQIDEDAKATASFREAIRLRPDFADAYSNLGAVLTVSDADEAVNELEKAVALQPGLLKAHYNLAIAYGSSTKHGLDKEITELRKLLALQADYPRAEFALGKALLKKGTVQEAVTHLELAVKAEPSFGEAQYQLGLALSRTGRNEEARKWLKDGRELLLASQRDQRVLLDLREGKAALDSGDVDQAVLKFQSAAKEKPDLAEAQFQLGAALLRRNEPDAAGEALRKALKLDPAHAAAQEMVQRLQKDDPALVATIEDHIRRNQFTEAQTKAEAYLKERPRSAWGWYALGYSLFAQKKIGDSITALAKSLSLDVTNGEAHKVLGRTLMIVGRFPEARREFEVGEKYAPSSAEIPFSLGRLFSIQDQWPEARLAFERSLRLDPEYMQALDGLGFALEALGDDAAARASYLKAAAMNEKRGGNFASPYVNLSALYNRTGEFDTALEYARKAVEINEQADAGWFQMARASERKGDLDAAASALNRAIGINARSSSYYYVLAAVYRKLGRQQESRAAMEMFTKLDRESNELEQKRRVALTSGASVHE